MKRLLHDIDALYTCDDAHSAYAGAYIVTDGDRIAEIGSGTPPDGAFDERIDLSGTLVVPGLVNMHHHFYQTLTRAIPATLRGHLIDWLRMMYPIWAGMTPDDLAAATEATAAELLLTGATTSVDHSYLMPRCDPAFIEAEIEAARGMGLRLHLVRGSLTELEAGLADELTALLGPRAGGLLDDADTVLAAMAQALGDHHETGWGAKVGIGLGPTTTTFADLGFMKRVADFAREAGANLHTHFHPRPDERALTAERFGKAPIEILEEAGWLTPRTFFAHSTRLDEEDMRRIAGAGGAVAHCPRMVMRLGARTTEVHRMRGAGVRVAVGVDGGASNDAGSMLGEMRIALLLHRLAGGEGAVPFESWLDPYDVLLMATREGAAILGRDDIGRIAVGACADIAAFPVGEVGLSGARADLLSGLLLAGDNDRAALTMVGGVPVVREGRLVGREEGLLGRAVDKAADRLVARAAAVTGIDYAGFPCREGRPPAPTIPSRHR